MKDSIKSALKETITKRIKNQIDWINEYNQTPDCAYAEYVESFSYGEIDIDDLRRNIEREIDDSEVFDAVFKPIFSMKDLSAILGAIADLCELTHITGLRSQTGEIHSVSMGEVEDQIYEETLELMADAGLKIEDLDADFDAFIKDDHIYIDLSYERWAMVLDFELIEERMKDLEPMDNVVNIR